MPRQGVIPYPGADDAEAYEWLNRCSDPDQRVEALMWSLAPPDGKILLDIGAGSAFHAVRYAERAARIIALEPDHRLMQQGCQRLRRCTAPNVVLVRSLAAGIPLPDRSVDVIHARFAYFFGTDGCLPGMREVKRVLQPDGHLFIIDADPDRGELGALARYAYPKAFPADYTQRNRTFYEHHGFRSYRVDTHFRAPSRCVLAQVFHMDYPHCYEHLLARVPGTTLTYGITLYHYHEAAAADLS